MRLSDPFRPLTDETDRTSHDTYVRIPVRQTHTIVVIISLDTSVTTSVSP